MTNNKLGELRRSDVIMTFGPGSVVDFRADGAPVSAVAGGIDEWDRSFPPAGMLNPQRITEPRLQSLLKVDGFRLPPVVDDNWQSVRNKPDNRTLVAARFPEWLQCPKCNRLAPAKRWAQEPGRAYRYCAGCTRKAPGQRKVFAVPARFVMACAKGHLDDFPWHDWVRHKAECKKKELGDLHLNSLRPGLAGLILHCRECNAQNSMGGVFSAQTFSNFTCRGRRPWLAAENETCDCEPRALQRGASNLYFPMTKSALSIPPWSDALQEALGIHWNTIMKTEAKDRADFIRILAKGDLAKVLSELNLSPEELAIQVEDRRKRIKDDEERIGRISDDEFIRHEEYRQFAFGTDKSDKNDREFEVRNVTVPDRLRPFLSKVVRVVRLREVRALIGFTRINPPGADQFTAAISVASKPTWYPAVDVRGEGIFLDFNLNTLNSWEMKDKVLARAESINNAWKIEWGRQYNEGEPELKITPRYLLVHTFAHALMRQLTLECGYSSAALRERLYVSDEANGMAGLLIYTATSDSDGTLGGLQRQGESIRIERAVEAAIRSMEWCSSDPLCIEGIIDSADGLSHSSCHACALAPETSCENYNRFLDRALLAGLPEEPDIGFFSPVIRERRVGFME